MNTTDDILIPRARSRYDFLARYGWKRKSRARVYAPLTAALIGLLIGYGMLPIIFYGVTVPGSFWIALRALCPAMTVMFFLMAWTCTSQVFSGPRFFTTEQLMALIKRYWPEPIDRIAELQDGNVGLRTAGNRFYCVGTGLRVREFYDDTLVRTKTARDLEKTLRDRIPDRDYL